MESRFGFFSWHSWVLNLGLIIFSELPSGNKRSHSDGWNDIPHFSIGNTSTQMVHFPASYVSLPECTLKKYHQIKRGERWGIRDDLPEICQVKHFR